MKGLFQCPPWARSFCPFRAYWVISTVQVEIITPESPQCPIHGRCGDFHPHPQPRHTDNKGKTHTSAQNAQHADR